MSSVAELIVTYIFIPVHVLWLLHKKPVIFISYSESSIHFLPGCSINLEKLEEQHVSLWNLWGWQSIKKKPTKQSKKKTSHFLLINIFGFFKIYQENISLSKQKLMIKKRSNFLEISRDKSWPRAMHWGMCLRYAFGWKMNETCQVLFRIDGEFWLLYIMDLDVLY